MGLRHLYIDGTDETGTEIFMDQYNWSITENAGSKSTFNFVISDTNGATINTGKEVRLYEDDTYLWGGYITGLIDESRDINEIKY